MRTPDTAWEMHIARGRSVPYLDGVDEHVGRVMDEHDQMADSDRRAVTVEGSGRRRVMAGLERLKRFGRSAGHTEEL